MEEDDQVTRLGRPEVDRTDPDRGFTGVWSQRGSENAYVASDEVIATGKRSAQQFSANEIAAEAVANGYDMVKEFLQRDLEDDPFGIPQTGQHAIGGHDADDLLSGLNGAGLTAGFAHMFTEYVQMWNGLFGRLLQGGDDPLSAFEDITGVRAGAPTPSHNTAVVLANRPVEVELHWNTAVPDSDVTVENLLPIDGKRKRTPKGMGISVRRSVDGESLVFDITIPESAKGGRYAGIIVDALGGDWGYLTITIVAD